MPIGSSARSSAALKHVEHYLQLGCRVGVCESRRIANCDADRPRLQAVRYTSLSQHDDLDRDGDGIGDLTFYEER